MFQPLGLVSQEKCAFFLKPTHRNYQNPLVLRKFLVDSLFPVQPLLQSFPEKCFGALPRKTVGRKVRHIYMMQTLP